MNNTSHNAIISSSEGTGKGLVRTNSLRAWFLAARPKTLTGAAAPVILALSAAWSDMNFADPGLAEGCHPPQDEFSWTPALLCFLFALLMQVDANFVNDYFDFRKGRDDRETRLGPQRACSEGWITPKAMKWGIAITTLLACLAGLPLVLWGGWWLVGIGVACVVFCFLYTTLLAGLGLGDVLVLVFFGLVPVCVTYFIQTGEVTLPVLLLSIGMGLATDCLLVVNNYRDREQDRTAGKRTIVVLLGGRFAEYLYLALGIVAVLLPLLPAFYSTLNANPNFSPFTPLPLLYLIPHILTWLRMKRLHSGRPLNAVLGQTAANIFLYAILESLSLLLA